MSKEQQGLPAVLPRYIAVPIAAILGDASLDAREPREVIRDDGAGGEYYKEMLAVLCRLR